MKRAILAGALIILFLIAGCTDTQNPGLENPEPECTEELCAEFIPGPPTLEECEVSLEVMIATDEFHLGQIIWEDRKEALDKIKSSMLLDVYRWTVDNEYITDSDKNWDEEIDGYFESNYGSQGANQFATRFALHLSALMSNKPEGAVKLEHNIRSKELIDLISETMDLEESFIEFVDPDCGPNNPSACYSGYYIIIDVTKMNQDRLMESASITAEDRVSGATVTESALPNERIEILILDLSIVEIAKEK